MSGWEQQMSAKFLGCFGFYISFQCFWWINKLGHTHTERQTYCQTEDKTSWLTDWLTNKLTWLCDNSASKYNKRETTDDRVKRKKALILFVCLLYDLFMMLMYFYWKKKQTKTFFVCWYVAASTHTQHLRPHLFFRLIITQQQTKRQKTHIYYCPLCSNHIFAFHLHVYFRSFSPIPLILWVIIICDRPPLETFLHFFAFDVVVNSQLFSPPSSIEWTLLLSLAS